LGCEDVNSGCEDINSVCEDVNLGCGDVNSGCGDVNSVSKDVNATELIKMALMTGFGVIRPVSLNTTLLTNIRRAQLCWHKHPYKYLKCI